MEKEKLPTTSELFQKHFNGVASVNLTHPNIDNFFNELNEVCLKEDAETLNSKAK